MRMELWQRAATPAAITIACLCGTRAASAALDGINDGGFETTDTPPAPAAPGSYIDDGGVDKWSGFASTAPFVTSTAFAHSGVQSIANGGATGANLYQFDTADAGTYVEGNLFSYSFWVYNNSAPAATRLRFNLNARNASNQAAGSVNVDATPTNTTVGQWTNFSGVFTATIPSPALSLGFANRIAVTITSNSTVAGSYYVDDVSVTAIAPEPCTLAALSLAGGLLTRRRRR